MKHDPETRQDHRIIRNASAAYAEALKAACPRFDEHQGNSK